jgi:hypothetical protein
MFRSSNEPFVRRRPAGLIDPKDPLASFEGRKGALLNVYSAGDGSLLKSIPLASVPAFDGMIATNGRIYMATNDGKLLCMAGRKKGHVYLSRKDETIAKQF